ncbi:unnamed protein product [Orchesella dallaii]|uniref:G-protein coupled receptors family 1 profile domain-containing protein n=1 Tax=Orchesella dallaii TaxID=48710 RepID=A0ABP1Q1S1_9HEXA
MEKNDLSQFHNFYHAGGSVGCGGKNITGNSSHLFNCSMAVGEDGSNVNDSNVTTTQSLDDLYPDFTQIPVVRGIFMFLFITECFVGVFGNLLVCLTVYGNKSMHSPVNYYIVNLGICDFLVGAFVLPMKLFELMADSETNMINDFWCTTLRFLESVVVFASVFTLVAICLERYYAVVYPVHSRINMTDGRIRRVIMAVWFIPILCAFPCLYPAKSVTHVLWSEYGEISRTTCFDQFSPDFRFGYFLFLFLFMYIIPLVFIAFTCLSITKALIQKIPVHPRRDPRAISLEHGRRKVAKMVLVVVFAFMFCWSPYFIITVITQVHYNFFAKGQFFFTMLIINLFAFTHSCINPIVYFSMSARFRKGFICILELVMLCMGRARYSPENSTSTIRRSIRRRGPHTSYSDVLHCHSSTRRASANVGSRGETASCHNFRHVDATTSDSCGKSPSRPKRVSRYGYRQESAELYPRPVLLQFDASREPQCCSQLIPLQERHPRRTNSLLPPPN